MKNNPRNSKRIQKLILAGAMMGMGVYAHANGEITLVDNQLTITGGGASSGFVSTPTIDADGVVETVVDVPSTNGVGIPSFSFTIDTEGVTDGSYDFRVGVVIDDIANERQMEAMIETLTLTFTGTEITGTIPGGQNLTLLGRDGSGMLEVSATIPNASSNGPVTLSGGTITFDAEDLIERIRNAHASFDSVILEEFDQPATYDYSIVVQQTSGAEVLRFGIGPTFDPFPTVGTGPCACVQPADIFKLGTLAASFDGIPNAGYTINGRFNVVFVADPVDPVDPVDPADPTDPADVDVDDAVEDLDDAVTGIAIPSSGPIPEETVAQVNDVLVSAIAATTAAATQIQNGTLPTSTALALLTSLNTVLDVAGDAATAGAAVNKANTVSSVQNMASVLNAMASKNTVLTGLQVLQITSLATTTVGNTAKFITTTMSSAETDQLVAASSNLLNSALANGATLTPEMTVQAKVLSTAAISNKLQKLADSVTGGVDLTDPTAVKALLKKPGVLTEMIKSTVIINSTEPLKAAEAKAEMLAKDVSEETVDRILASMAGIVSNLTGVTNSSGTAKDALANALFAAFSGGQALSAQNGLILQAATESLAVEVDDVTGAMRIGNSAESYAAISTDARLVTDDIEDGIYYLADGRALAVSGGFGVELAPMAADMLGFAAVVENAGFSFDVRADGSVEIDTGGGESFSGVFAYDNIAGNTGDCGAITVVEPTGHPASARYAFGVNCANGIEQRVLPFVSSPAFYAAVLNFGLEATTDRNTGFVTIPTVGTFKPSFFVSTPTPADTTYLTENLLEGGIAVRASDLNSDGSIDFEVISSDGVQALYGAQ